MAEICEQAAVLKGSFFHFFASKEGLLLAVLDHHREQMRSGFLEPAFRPDVPPLDRLRRYFEAVGSQITRELRAEGRMCGCPIGNISSELSTRSEIVRERVAAVFDDTRNAFRKALREAIDAGDLPASTDANTAATALLAYMQGLAVLGKTYNQPRLLQRLVRQAFAVAGLPV